MRWLIYDPNGCSASPYFFTLQQSTKIFIAKIRLLRKLYFGYRNDPKVLDRYAWANSADPDQTAPTVCHSICIVWTHYSMAEPHSSKFRVITTNFLGVRIFRKITVHQDLWLEKIERNRHLDFTLPNQANQFQEISGHNDMKACLHYQS